MARPTITGTDPIEFAESQGEVLMQILFWLTAALSDDERKPFIKGAVSVVTRRYAEAVNAVPPATKPAARRKAGRK